MRQMLVGAVLMLGALAYAGSLANAASPQRRRAPRNVVVAPLQQAADSLQVRVAWTPPQQGAGSVTGYTVRATASGWLRESSTTFLADSLWLPRDTVDVVSDVCVRALAGAVEGPPACTSFTIAKKIILGPPGIPTVTPIGNLSALVDSVRVIVAGQSPTDTITSAKLYLVAWMDGPQGSPIPVMCSEQPSGEIGWGEVELIGTSRVRPVAGGGFLPDACRWEIAESDSMAEIRNLVLGPVPFLPRTVLLTASFYGFDGTLWEVLLEAVTPLGQIPMAGVVIEVDVLTGTWGSGDALTRLCTTDASGACGPGRLTAGGSLRLTADGAVPAVVVAGTAQQVAW